jgi:murein DD-endopeptidase MepM/ murein hydrolase activator NlpD
MFRYSPILMITLLFFVIVSPAGSQETTPESFYADDENFQEFNGKLGKWVFVPNKVKLQSFMKEFGCTESDLSDLNPGVQKYLNHYVFFPYSAEYIQKLNDKGFERVLMSATPDQFIWPVGDVARISSVLGFRGRGEFHTGLDIPSPRGAPIRAAMEGQVIYEGYQGGYGNMIDIQHRNGFISRYGHATAALVKKGEFVKKGQIIGLVGSTGRSTGNHVHFEILCNTIPLDPLDFLPDSSKIQIVHRLKNWKHK